MGDMLRGILASSIDQFVRSFRATLTSSKLCEERIISYRVNLDEHRRPASNNFEMAIKMLRGMRSRRTENAFMSKIVGNGKFRWSLGAIATRFASCFYTPVGLVGTAL